MTRTVEPIAYTRAEAAESLGMSLRHFEQRVQPDLKLIRSGRLRLVPRAELERWAEAKAEPTLGEAL